MLVFLGGCWDYHEMVEFADVTALAIDMGTEKKYKITLEGKKFSPKIDIEVEPILFDSEGDTVIEAIRGAIKSAGKRIYIGSVKSIIISEEFAQQGITPILDMFYRTNRARLLARVYVARGVEASKLLEDTAVYSVFAGYEIAEIGEQISGKYGYSPENELYKTIDRLYDKYKNPMLFALGEIEQPKDRKTFTSKGIACFKDDKLIGYIEDELIGFYGAMVDRFIDGIASVPYEDKGHIGINIFKLNSKRRFKMIEGKVNLFLDLKMEIVYSENNTDLQITGKIDVELIKKLVDEYFKKKINELHQFVKEELKHDVLEIEEFFRKYNYKQWKKNGDDYDYVNDVVINVSTNIKVRGAGHVRIE